MDIYLDSRKVAVGVVPIAGKRKVVLSILGDPCPALCRAEKYDTPDYSDGMM